MDMVGKKSDFVKDKIISFLVLKSITVLQLANDSDKSLDFFHMNTSTLTNTCKNIGNSCVC